MKKTLFPLLLIILLPGCLNLRGKKRQANSTSRNQITLKNKKNVNCDKEIDFILEDDINDCDPYLVKNKSKNKLEAAEEIDWDKASDYSLEQKELTIHFDYDKSNIKALENALIKTNVTNIKNKLNKNPDLTVLVEGHSCLIAKNQEYNHMLSQERANQVAKAYKEQGIPADCIKTIGRGTTEVLSSVMDEDHQSPNRRVETTILDL